MSDKNLKDKLKLLQAHVGSHQKQNKPTINIPNRYQSLADFLDGKITTNTYGAVCIVKEKYPIDYIHGSHSFNHSIKEFPMAPFLTKETSDIVPVESLVFFDTETTGLGGSGAVAFLIGCGSVVNDGFEVRQYLIPDYSDETAMLEMMFEEFGDDKNIVSFNGAAFDIPLVRTRMIINRVAKEVPFDKHIDLLHPSRRLFKRRLQDCTLTNLERELFHFYRKDDIPGYLIPSVYFEWLSEQNSNPLKNVLLHNRLDILSLYYLMVHIAEIFQNEGATLDSVDDLHSLSKIYGRKKQIIKSLDIYKKMNEVDYSGLSDDINYFHSLSFKKTGNLQKAVEIWTVLAGKNNREGFLSCIELSKYYEHKLKDIQNALIYVTQAKNICPSTKTHTSDLKKRYDRLKKKA